MPRATWACCSPATAIGVLQAQRERRALKAWDRTDGPWWGTRVAGRQTRGTRCDPREKRPMTPQAALPQPDSSATGSSTMWGTGARDDMTIPSQVVELLEEVSEA